jgi:hypothetical protein
MGHKYQSISTQSLTISKYAWSTLLTMLVTKETYEDIHKTFDYICHFIFLSKLKDKRVMG